MNKNKKLKGGIGINDLCLCGSRVKYKYCCNKKVDWGKLQYKPLSEVSRHLTITGKNIQFLNSVAGALQLDSFPKGTPFPTIKRAMSVDVVRQVYSSISDLWPDQSDYERVLESERSSTTAIYTGNYTPEIVFKNLTRLSLYCDKIFIVDPFMRPECVVPQYNPLEHPDQYRGTTLKFLYLWMTLLPWINAGIVSFIRPLDDFNPGLRLEILKIQQQRVEDNPSLINAYELDANEYLANCNPLDRGLGELMSLLLVPDIELCKIFDELKHHGPYESKEEFIGFVHKRRNEHPYYLERLPGQTEEIYHESSGPCYELAKRMCALTDSHIVTNMKARWKEVEIDRGNAGIDSQEWSPFAKALQDADFKILDNVPLQAVLTLREENRLSSMRDFFRRVWKESSNPDKFSETNATDLAAQLGHEVAIANDEWSKIDRNLLKWFGNAASAAGAAAIVSGYAGFVPAATALAVTGVARLVNAQMERSSFKSLYPAGFFIGKK